MEADRAVSRAVRSTIFAIFLSALSISSAVAETMQLAIDGVVRTYLLERPATQEARPTIIMLHGAGGSAVQEARSTGLGELAPREGFVAVFPEGRGGRWNHLPPGKESAQFVGVFEPYGGAPDDVAFLTTLVADLIRRGISDPKQIFLAGESAGGIMALRMLCADAELFAGIGLLIAAMPEPTATDCYPAKPLRVLMINGTADRVLPYDGGPSAPPDRAFATGTFNVWPTERLFDFFHRLNICVTPADRSVAAGRHEQRIEIEQSTQCGGGPIISYRIVGGGHAVPADLDVGQLLLSFFR
jgi:polyhydroxybutyrate depolymerase